MNDPILEDLHATRERMLAESGGTLDGLVSRLQKKQSASERPIWEPRRTKHCIEVADQPLPEEGTTSATR